MTEKLFDSSIEGLCEGDPAQYFIIPPELDARFREALKGFCKVNFTSIGTKFGDLFTGVMVS